MKTTSYIIIGLVCLSIILEIVFFIILKSSEREPVYCHTVPEEVVQPISADVEIANTEELSTFPVADRVDIQSNSDEEILVTISAPEGTSINLDSIMNVNTKSVTIKADAPNIRIIYNTYD